MKHLGVVALTEDGRYVATCAKLACGWHQPPTSERREAEADAASHTAENS